MMTFDHFAAAKAEAEGCSTRPGRMHVTRDPFSLAAEKKVRLHDEFVHAANYFTGLIQK